MSRVEIGVAIKCGLRLSYDQYDGLRNLLSYDFDQTASRHVLKQDSKTGLTFATSAHDINNSSFRFRISGFANQSKNQILDGRSNETARSQGQRQGKLAHSSSCNRGTDESSWNPTGEWEIAHSSGC